MPRRTAPAQASKRKIVVAVLQIAKKGTSLQEIAGGETRCVVIVTERWRGDVWRTVGCRTEILKKS